MPQAISAFSQGAFPSDSSSAPNCDMFMKMQGSKSGPIKGESRDPDHLDEIEVLSWAWGMQGNVSASASSGEKAQTSFQELIFFKRADPASTSLMNACRGNDRITKAELTVRKAGGGKVDFFKVTLEDGRIRSLSIEGGAHASGQQIIERVAMSFRRITVDYRAQQSSGGSGATSSFVAEISS